jgi:phosphonate transport system substrate-binding protein
MIGKLSGSLVRLATLILCLMFVPRLYAQPRDGAAGETLSLGLVSQTDRQQIEQHFRDFADYVSRKVAPSSAAPKVVVAGTAPELAKLLGERKVDYYMESAYPTYVINDVHNAAKLLLRRWKGGLADYYSVVFVRAGSPIKRLEDLKGKTIAFEDPGSTSGYLLPKLFLQRHGLKLAEQRQGAAAGAADLAYVFAQSQEKLVDAVLSGRAAAGAFSNDDLATIDPKKKSEIAVLAQTDWLPRHLLSIRRDLPPGTAERLQAVLLGMHENPEGRKILENADGTTKFDLLPGGETAMRRRLLESFYSPK